MRNVQELVSYARSRRNDPLFYLNPGIGTLSHLNMELLSRALDFPTQGAVYKGCPLYPSDAADEESGVDLGGLRFPKNKKPA